MNPADLTSYIGTLAGLLALVISLWRFKGEDRDRLIDQLQEEYKRLVEQVKQLSDELSATKAKLDTTETKLEETERGRGILRQRVDELIQENVQLHQLIGALNERTKTLPDAAMRRMREIAAEIAELYEYVSQEYPDELIDEKVTHLLGLVTGIPSLIEG